MKEVEYKLPWWIKVSSYLFCIMLTAPLFLIISYLFGIGSYSVGMLGVELEQGTHSEILILIMYICLTLAGVTALLILWKHKMAFKVGITYVVLSCMLTIPLQIIEYGHFEDEKGSSILNYVLLVAFLIHMVRNFSKWDEYCAVK